MKRKKTLKLLCVQLIVGEDDMCGSGMCLYTVHRSVSGIVSFFSLSVCVQSVIESVEKIVQADENDRLSIFLISFLETMSPFFLPLV